MSKHLTIIKLYPAVTIIRGDIAYDADGNVVEYDESVVTSETNIMALREVRNTKLAETDWVVTMHKELGTNIPAAWKTYRQALRDITDTYTSLDDVVWPEKP
jgi:hypothetical protein